MSAIEQLFEDRQRTPSDINEHMSRLRRLASACDSIVEFGVRSGNSTVAMLAGLDSRINGGTLYSFDISNPQFEPPPMARAVWEFTQHDTGKLLFIPSCDLLFIDTLHTAAQVEAELKHAHMVKNWIAFHDTVLFGCRDEGTAAPIGINHAIWLFLGTSEGRNWHPMEHHANNCGLLILKRHKR